MSDELLGDVLREDEADDDLEAAGGVGVRKSVKSFASGPYI